MEEKIPGFVRHTSDISEKEMDGGARIRWLITHRDGAPTFSMRHINIPVGKSTPFHSHDYEHEIFLIEGEIEATIGDLKCNAIKGDFLFIPPNAFHGMKAVRDAKLICVVPVKVAREMLGS